MSNWSNAQRGAPLESVFPFLTLPWRSDPRPLVGLLAMRFDTWGKTDVTRIIQMSLDYPNQRPVAIADIHQDARTASFDANNLDVNFGSARGWDKLIRPFGLRDSRTFTVLYLDYFWVQNGYWESKQGNSGFNMDEWFRKDVLQKYFDAGGKAFVCPVIKKEFYTHNNILTYVNTRNLAIERGQRKKRRVRATEGTRGPMPFNLVHMSAADCPFVVSTERIPDGVIGEVPSLSRTYRARYLVPEVEFVAVVVDPKLASIDAVRQLLRHPEKF